MLKGSFVATLLDGTNEVLKKLQLIQGDSGLLTTLSDPPRQTFVDKIVQGWNEVVDELYSTADKPLPKALAENTITLATDDRDYALQSDLVELFIGKNGEIALDETNGRHIWHRDYMTIVSEQFQPGNWTGTPLFGGIRPSDGELYLDRIPTANENGLIYKYRYLKDVSVSAATDVFPFTDAVFRALVPAVAEYVRIPEERDFNAGVFATNLGRAARLLNQVSRRRSWSSRS